ncbi:MAG: GNAT family N-acetyltransferase [Chloroflexi bacterium]|nr:GNAT family N-acetyltransferase [Chloroflexota bacterium]
MAEKVVIKPMDREFLLWRCLHEGPLTAETLEQPPANAAVDWEHRREVNIPLLAKLVETYGSCAMLAWDGDAVVGMLRFYPKALLSLEGAGEMCLQQEPPHGPSEALLEQPFPPLCELADKTLLVSCMMTGSPQWQNNPYQRVGLGTRLAKSLLDWAKVNGWERVEAAAYEDVDAVYRITGQAGRAFWERLGFLVTRVEKAGFEGEFLELVERQVRAQGLDARSAQNKYTMRRELR